MSKYKLILTTDYEVWGDGSGCVENCVIEPTNKMLSIADEFKAKVTIFFDVCEYWAFEKIESLGVFNGDYRPASLMKKQLQEAIMNGHEVQLHFHPQWLNYNFISNHKWNLDMRYWSLPSVEDYHNSDWSLDKLFNEGRKTLENMFLPVDSKYSVYAFRAGAWCIQPEEKVLNAISNHEILIDSSVAGGMISKTKLGSYDFSAAPDLPSWRIGASVIEEGESSLREVPISTVRFGGVKKVLFKILKLKNYNRLVAENCRTNGSAGYNKKEKSFGSFFKGDYQMLNFSDGTSFLEMKSLTIAIMKRFKDFSDGPIPIVAISHPKTFGNEGDFYKYLKWINGQEEIAFGTYKDLI